MSIAFHAAFHSTWKKETNTCATYILSSGREYYWNLSAYSSEIRSLLPSSYMPQLVSSDFNHSIHATMAAVRLTPIVEGYTFILVKPGFVKLRLLSHYRSKWSKYIFRKTLLTFWICQILLKILWCTHQTGDKKTDFLRACVQYPGMWIKPKSTFLMGQILTAYLPHNECMFYKEHPDVYFLTDALLEIQKRSYLKMLSIGLKK